MHLPLRVAGRWAATLLVAPLIAGMLVACSTSSAPKTPAASPKISARPSYDPRQLSDTQTAHVGGRPYYYFPKTDTGPLPLVLVLHGLSTGPARIASDSRFTTYARTHRIAIAYGSGLDHAWNAGDCCQDDRADDTGYLVGIVNDLAHRLHVDRRRVYIAGFSNGGMMAFRAVCERPDVFAAAGVMSGALVTPCRPLTGIRSRPVYVRQFHGLSDTTVPVTGGYSRLLGLDVPATSTEAARLPPHSVLDVTLLRGLGHYWATKANSGVDATAAFVSWLLAHRL